MSRRTGQKETRRAAERAQARANKEVWGRKYSEAGAPPPPRPKRAGAYSVRPLLEPTLRERAKRRTAHRKLKLVKHLSKERPTEAVAA